MRINILLESCLVRQKITPTPFENTFGYVTIVSFPVYIIINVNAKTLCASGKRDCISINYYEFFLNVGILMLSMVGVLIMPMCNLLLLFHCAFFGISILLLFLSQAFF